MKTEKFIMKISNISHFRRINKIHIWSVCGEALEIETKLNFSILGKLQYDERAFVMLLLFSSNAKGTNSKISKQRIFRSRMLHKYLCVRKHFRPSAAGALHCGNF